MNNYNKLLNNLQTLKLDKIKENYFNTPLTEMGKNEDQNNIIIKTKESILNLYE